MIPRDWPHRAALLLILLAAAALRFQYLLQIEHNVDHAYPIWQALQTLDHGVFPLAGQGTSVLFANPALTGYLYLPLIALTRSPLGAYLLVIALNTLGVLLAYRAARALQGERLALIAAALMAVNPWVIEYSRTSWVQSLLPFFVSAAAWLLWPVLLGTARRPVRRLALALTMLALLAQTYLLGYALLAPVGLLIAIFWRRIPKRGLVIGGAVIVALTAVYGVGLLSQRDVVEDRLSAFTGDPPRLSSEALEHAVRLVSGADYAAARGTQAPAGDADLRQTLSRIAHVGAGIALIAGAAVAIGHLLRGSPRQRDTAVIALIWFGVPIALMSYVGQVVHPFYLLLSLPAGYALAAWGIGALLRPQSRVGAAIVLALLLPFTVLMAVNSARYYQETAALPGAHDLSALPLEYGLQLGAEIKAHLPEGGLVMADVDGWTLSSFAGMTFDFAREARAPLVNVIPAQGGLYIAAIPPDAPAPAPLGASPAAQIALPDGWTLSVDAFAPVAALPTDAVPFEVGGDHGMALAGYALERGDDGWLLTTYWRISARDVAIDQTLFAPFAHLFDANGARVAVIDGAAVPGYLWRAGDLHAQRMRFTPPAGAAAPLMIAVGQYDALNQANILFTVENAPSTLIPLPVTLPR
jgi:4-amino-4-deoxy-L-arabinose transferase-like glycosyltransferase